MRRIVLAGLLLIALAEAAEAQRVGVTAAVNPRAISYPPGSTQRELLLGSDVIFKQRLSTHDDGLAQLLFVDRSMLTIGRNADVLIDEFVFDPATSAGKLTATVTRGIGRYVGGVLSKTPGQVTFTTPAATIGVRGGVVLFKVDEDGTTTVAMVHGREVRVTTPQGVREIYRNDYGVTVDRAGAFLDGGPRPISRELQSSMTEALESHTTRASGSDASLGEREVGTAVSRATAAAQAAEAARQARVRALPPPAPAALPPLPALAPPVVAPIVAPPPPKVDAPAPPKVYKHKVKPKHHGPPPWKKGERGR
jgi:hypothetical protein